MKAARRSLPGRPKLIDAGQHLDGVGRESLSLGLDTSRRFSKLPKRKQLFGERAFPAGLGARLKRQIEFQVVFQRHQVKD